VKVITMMQGTLGCNNMADDCSPSNQHPPACPFTGQQASAGSQETESTDFQPPFPNFQRGWRFQICNVSAAFLAHLRISHADQTKGKNS